MKKPKPWLKPIGLKKDYFEENKHLGLFKKISYGLGLGLGLLLLFFLWLIAK